MRREREEEEEEEGQTLWSTPGILMNKQNQPGRVLSLSRYLTQTVIRNRKKKGGFSSYKKEPILTLYFIQPSYNQD